MKKKNIAIEDLTIIAKRKFPLEEKIGVITRIFVTKPEHVPEQVKAVLELVDRFENLALSDSGEKIIKRIDILVWADKSFSISDCGETARELREVFVGRQNVFISEVKQGDIFCGILNYGCQLQLSHGCQWSIIVSKEVRSYVNNETIQAMLECAAFGARAIGVAVGNLTESVLEGRLASTFCMWHLPSLLTVGGFSLVAAKRSKKGFSHLVQGWKEYEGEVDYELAGVEEMIPLAEMIRAFGPCIVPILPRGKGIKYYQVPDDPELRRQHEIKMRTKFARQLMMLKEAGADDSYLTGGIMSGLEIYRQILP